MGLRCGTYGVHMGLSDCGVGSMGKSMGMAMGLDLCGSMGLWCGTYGVHTGLWDCGVGPMGKSMGICFLFCCFSLSPFFFVLAMLSYGISPMGSVGTYVPAVWDLWDSYRSMGLRCGIYGVIYGDLWDDLWGPQVLTQLRSNSYGVKILLWVCDARSMGISSAHAAAVQ